MKGKRSKGVSVFAWVMIIVNLYALVSSLQFKGTFFNVYKSFPKSFNVLIIWGSILLAVIALIAGFGILRLKEGMRKTGIAVNLIDLLFGVPLFFLSLNDIREYTRFIAVSELATEGINLTVDKLANLGFQTVIAAVWASFAFNLLFIFFFTRTKIKEQFQ